MTAFMGFPKLKNLQDNPTGLYFTGFMNFMGFFKIKNFTGLCFTGLINLQDYCYKYTGSLQDHHLH